MATAVTTGAVALVLQKHPSLSPDQVKYRLMATARQLTAADGSPAVGLLQQGAGRLWVPDAINAKIADGNANAGMDLQADLEAGWGYLDNKGQPVLDYTQLSRHYLGPVRKALSDNGAYSLYYILNQDGSQVALGVTDAANQWLLPAQIAAGASWSSGEFVWPGASCLMAPATWCGAAASFSTLPATWCGAAAIWSGRAATWCWSRRQPGLERRRVVRRAGNLVWSGGNLVWSGGNIVWMLPATWSGAAAAVRCQPATWCGAVATWSGAVATWLDAGGNLVWCWRQQLVRCRRQPGVGAAATWCGAGGNLVWSRLDNLVWSGGNLVWAGGNLVRGCSAGNLVWTGGNLVWTVRQPGVERWQPGMEWSATWCGAAATWCGSGDLDWTLPFDTQSAGLSTTTWVDW